jgi:Na+/H+ antiporter NhaD/arsenite permease-like protein
MEFFIAFSNFALALWLAWRGQGQFALYVFLVGLVFGISIFLRHTTTALPLSF